MRILTFNTWQEKGPWRDRWEIIFSDKASSEADIVGFQEVFKSAWMLVAKERLHQRNLVFAHEKSGLAILTQYAVLEWDCVQLLAKSPSENFSRYVLYAKMDVEGRPLCVFNTHLSWLPGEADVRLRQIEEILEYINKKAHREETLLLGDFNTAPNTKEVKKVLNAGFVDCFARANPGKEAFTWDNKANPFARSSSEELPDRRIDYIFARKSEALLAMIAKAERVFTKPNAAGVYASDHFGMLVTFEEPDL